jgi:hypothetical protein
MSYAKKIEITFFRENWPDDHDFDGKTEIAFFRENWNDDHD